MVETACARAKTVVHSYTYALVEHKNTAEKMSAKIKRGWNEMNKFRVFRIKCFECVKRFGFSVVVSFNRVMSSRQPSRKKKPTKTRQTFPMLRRHKQGKKETLFSATIDIRTFELLHVFPALNSVPYKQKKVSSQLTTWIQFVRHDWTVLIFLCVWFFFSGEIDMATGPCPSVCLTSKSIKLIVSVV